MNSKKTGFGSTLEEHPYLFFRLPPVKDRIFAGSRTIFTGWTEPFLAFIFDARWGNFPGRELPVWEREKKEEEDEEEGDEEGEE